jgi:hypothetical protein
MKTIVFCNGPWDGVTLQVGSLPTEIILDFRMAEACPKFIRDERQRGIRVKFFGDGPMKYVPNSHEGSDEYRYEFSANCGGKQ